MYRKAFMLPLPINVDPDHEYIYLFQLIIYQSRVVIMPPIMKPQTPSSIFLAAPFDWGAAGTLPIGVDVPLSSPVSLAFVYGPLYPVAVTPVPFMQGPKSAVDEKVISAHYNTISMSANATLNAAPLVETLKGK